VDGVLRVASYNVRDLKDDVDAAVRVVRAIEPDHFVACHFPLIGETAPPVASNGATNGASPPGPSGRRG